MLVATVLTTALITGAAKGAGAAPASKPQAVSVARRLAAKLTTSFRQVLPAARLAPLRVTTDTTTVVAIDPAVSNNEGSDETGIVVAGIGGDKHTYVIEDLSGRYAPHEWAALRFAPPISRPRVTGGMTQPQRSLTLEKDLQ